MQKDVIKMQYVFAQGTYAYSMLYMAAPGAMYLQKRDVTWIQGVPSVALAAYITSLGTAKLLTGWISASDPFIPRISR